MPPPNGIELALQAAAQPPPQIVKILHPFNDVQLLALLAGHIAATAGHKPEVAVEEAANILAISITRGVPILNDAMRRHGVHSPQQVPRLQYSE